MNRLARALSTLALLAPAVLAACSSSGSPPSHGTGTSSGTVGGQSLPVKDATYYDDFGTTEGSFFDRVTIYVRSTPRACVATANTTGFVFYVEGSGTSVGRGEYALGVPDGGPAGIVVARGILEALDGQCQSLVQAQDEVATGGTLTISGKTSSDLTGSYDAVFPDGELTGTFDAQEFDCASVDAGTPSNACP